MPGTVLICDDDPIFSEFLADALVYRGFVVYKVSDPDLLKNFLEGYAAPDVIILDFQMPGGGGPEALRYLKASEKTRNVPVIVCSSMQIDRLAEWFPDQTKLRLRMKPVKVEDILSSIVSLFGESSPGSA